MNAQRDWISHPLSAFVLWCFPLLAGFAANVFAPPRIVAFIWTACLAWMGVGCVLNARRCHRLHCYISGPLFFLGAAATGMLATGVPGTGVLGTGPHVLNNTVGITLALALLSFLPEMIWRKYLR